MTDWRGILILPGWHFCTHHPHAQAQNVLQSAKSIALLSGKHSPLECFTKEFHHVTFCCDDVTASEHPGCPPACLFFFLSGFYHHIALYTGLSRPAVPCIPQRGCVVAGSHSSNSQRWESDTVGWRTGLQCFIANKKPEFSEKSSFCICFPHSEGERRGRYIVHSEDNNGKNNRKDCWSTKQLATVAAVLESWRWRQTFQQRSHDLLLLVQGPTWNLSIWRCSTYRLCI